MKLLSLPLLLTLLASTVCAALAESTVRYSWDFTKATAASGFVNIPPSSGDFPLNFQNGATVTTDPDEAGRPVVILDGTQTEPGRTNRNLAPLPSVMLRIRFKPTTTGEALQTIVTAGGIYELRFNRERGTLEFIVNSQPDKKYIIVRADVSTDVWNQAVATYKDGKLTLSVGLARKEGTIPADMNPVSIPTSVRIGLVGTRPFIGAISELTVSDL